MTERLHAHGQTLNDVKLALRDLGSKMDAKLISGGQMFVIFAGLLSLSFVLGGTGKALHIGSRGLPIYPTGPRPR